MLFVYLRVNISSTRHCSKGSILYCAIWPTWTLLHDREWTNEKEFSFYPFQCGKLERKRDYDSKKYVLKTLKFKHWTDYKVKMN